MKPLYSYHRNLDINLHHLTHHYHMAQSPHSQIRLKARTLKMQDYILPLMRAPH